jgi:hypothetical protein
MHLENMCRLLHLYTLAFHVPLRVFTVTLFAHPVSCLMTMHFSLTRPQRYGFLRYFLSAVTMLQAAGEVSVALLAMQITRQGCT